MRDFDGLTAVVTGGASGIGEAVATTLQERGARVYALDREAGTTASGVQVLAADVTDQPGVTDAVDHIAAEAGGIDVLVNNAGIGAVGTVADNDLAEWQRVFDVNVFGAVRVSRAALPYLRRSAAAAVVMTTSIAAHVGLPKRAVYSSSKGALVALVRSMAADHLAEGIRVCAVSPGTADTPWVGRLLDAAADPAAERAALEARQPTGRLVTPQQVAHAVAYLASPLAGATTGTVLDVDGGFMGVRLPAAPAS